jgi:hypothetical protein
VLAESARFNVVNCGRRFGKTTLGVYLAITTALEGKLVGWFSPTYKMLTEVWEALKSRLRDAIAKISEQGKRIELLTGGVIEMWSLDTPDAARGRRYHRVIVDEAAMIAKLETAWNEVIRPTLIDFRGDAWFMSTPKGRNFYWTLYQRGQDSQQTDWRSWSMASDQNPHLPPDELAQIIRDMPELAYLQEIRAVFLEDGGTVFRGVIESATAELQDEPIIGHDYALGVDWGKVNDFTVLMLIDLDTREVCTVDRFNQIDYTVQTDRLKALYERFRPVTVIAELNSIGEPLIERLVMDSIPVEPFQTTNATKKAAIEALAMAFERRELRIPNDPVLIAELQAYEAERLPSGLIRYNAPEGMHDDCVMALALAWQAAARPPAAAASSDVSSILDTYGASRRSMSRFGGVR